MATAALVGAALLIQVIEYLNRTRGGGFFNVLLWTGPLIMGAQYLLYYGWHHAKTAIGAWVAFSLLCALMRLVAVYLFYPEKLNARQVVGTLVIMLGAWVSTRG